jgi:hypothetical protein
MRWVVVKYGGLSDHHSGWQLESMTEGRVDWIFSNESPSELPRKTAMTTPIPLPILIFGMVAAALVIYVAYQIGKVLLRVFVGLAALALLSWGLWKFFYS